MITPTIDIKQNDDEIIIEVIAKYIQTSDLEYLIEKDSFLFSCNPYYLRLSFKEELSIEPTEKVNYDTDSSTFTFNIKKANPGHHFTGLNMLTSLLNPKQNPDQKYSSKIQVENIDDSKWQDILEKKFSDLKITNKIDCALPRYGFMNKYDSIHLTHMADFEELFPYPALFLRQSATKIQEIFDIEDLKFDPDYYLADFYDEEKIYSLINYEINFNSTLFNITEREFLLKLSNKEYLVDDSNVVAVFNGLFNIILAFVYDLKITESEHNVVSAWNIVNLSSTLCYNVIFEDLNGAVQSFFRRSMCYPLVRNYHLSVSILEDVKKMFRSGLVSVISALISIHKIFNNCDRYYLLNEMFIKDYIIYLQKIPDESNLFKSFLDKVYHLKKPNKCDLFLDLDYYEKLQL